MNLLSEFFEALAVICRARAVATQKSKVPAPRLAQVVVDGPGMVKVIDFDTRQVLGFRSTPAEAHTLARQLERGEFCA